MQMCKLAVYPRRGYLIDQCYKEAESLKRETGVEIVFVSGPIIEISSSDIRKRIEAGKSIRYLVPDPVRNYIREHSLYS